MHHRSRLAMLLGGAMLASSAVAPVHGAVALGPDDIAPDRDERAVRAERADEVRLIRYPVSGDVTYDDTFGACRGTRCERRHMGIDLFAPKLTPLVAAQAGRVTWLRDDASGTAGNGIAVTDAEGWRYLYLHVNNDTPGTDDGANPPAWRFAEGIALDAHVEAGDLLGHLGDSGNAETTPPHLHFELRRPDGVTINPYPSLRHAEP